MLSKVTFAHKDDEFSKLRPFTLIIVLLGAIVCFLVLLTKTEVEITASEQRRFDSYQLADELRQSSDDLTNMARLFVITGKERFAQQFQEILDIRSGKQPRPKNYGLIYNRVCKKRVRS